MAQGRATNVALRTAFTGALLMGLAVCTRTPEDPLVGQLAGGWRLAKVCQYDVPSGVEPCSPVASMAEQLRFDETGAAREAGPSGASGQYEIERRELAGGGTETLLSIGGRNMGQLSFAGDTLLLGTAYVDGVDRYFVRLPDAAGAGTPGA